MATYEKLLKQGYNDLKNATDTIVKQSKEENKANALFHELIEGVDYVRQVMGVIEGTLNKYGETVPEEKEKATNAINFLKRLTDNEMLHKYRRQERNVARAIVDCSCANKTGLGEGDELTGVFLEQMLELNKCVYTVESTYCPNDMYIGQRKSRPNKMAVNFYTTLKNAEKLEKYVGANKEYNFLIVKPSDKFKIFFTVDDWEYAVVDSTGKVTYTNVTNLQEDDNWEKVTDVHYEFPPEKYMQFENLFKSEDPLVFVHIGDNNFKRRTLYADIIKVLKN